MGNVVERFWSKVDKDGPVPEYRPDLGPCWLWTASRVPDGYGQFWLDGTNARAHRVAYEFLVGPISDGLTLDHLCRVRHCVRPEHLEPVTDIENLRRGDGVPARNARKTTCDNGHELTEENLYRFGPDRRWRACRTCRRDADREAKRRLRASRRLLAPADH